MSTQHTAPARAYTARSAALAARAARSFVAPVTVDEGDGLIVRATDNWHGETEGSRIAHLRVLNTEGDWQPARSLYEYVQQNVVEVCASWIEARAGETEEDALEREYGDGGPEWYDARVVYAKPVGMELHTIDKLLECVTPRFAEVIVEQRRTEEKSMRTLRVVAARANVPPEIAAQIEAFAGLLPARDAIPFRREQLPAFMERLCEMLGDDDQRTLDMAHVSSGHLRGVEIWKGGFSDGKNLHGDWILFPKKCLQEFLEHTFVFGWDDYQDAPGFEIEVENQPPGHHTFIVEDADEGEQEVTYECIIERPCDFYLQVENAWPAGTSIEDEAHPKCKGAVISNTGFAVCQGYNKEAYAIQRSAKNAGRILGYSNFWYVSTANDCMRHHQLQKTGTFDPFTDREIHYI